MDFEQKLEQDKKDKKREVGSARDEDEKFYRARAMRLGMEQMRTLSTQNDPLKADQMRMRTEVRKMIGEAKEVEFDYDHSSFTLDEVQKAAVFYTTAKEYGYSSEVDVTDNPILYKKVADETDPGKTKLKKRGYFEKKSIKKSAKAYKKKFEDMYKARVNEELVKYSDKDVYDIGKDISYDAQIKFSDEEIDGMRNRDLLKVDMKDPESRFLLGLPTEPKNKEKEEDEKRKIDKLYEDFGEIQNLMNTSVFKKYLIMNPSFWASYGDRTAFVPGLFAGAEDFYKTVNNVSKWTANPSAYGFVVSDDTEVNGGLNTAALMQFEAMLKKVMILSSMSRQAEAYKGCINSLLSHDAFGITEEETEETIAPHNKKASDKAFAVSKELSDRLRGAMQMLIKMNNDILRHVSYTGDDRSEKGKLATLPTMKSYMKHRTSYWR